MMIQISSFRSRAQIAQLIEETTNQIKKKPTVFENIQCFCLLRRDVEHTHRFLENERKKSIFTLLLLTKWSWRVEVFEPAEAKRLHGCNLQARKDDLDQLVFVSEILKQDSKTFSKKIQPNLRYIQRII